MKKIVFQLLISLTLLMSIFSCFRKKENLESWLNKKFPGQFELTDSRTKFLSGVFPTVSFMKKVTSVVELKSDTDVQFVIIWYKDKPDLMVTVEEIQNASDQSKKEVSQARALYKSYTENGSAKVSVAIVDDAAYFLVFEEPTLDNRKKYLQEVLTTLNNRNDPAQTKIWIEFMEDSTYHQEFKDIIPKGFWNRIDHYYQDNKTVSLEFVWSKGMKTDTLMSKWTLNILSARSNIYRAEAYQVALTWAEKNIKPPYYIEPDKYVWNDLDEHDLMAMHFHFPYFPSRNPEDSNDLEANRRGFVSGVYQADHKTFTKIKTEKELRSEWTPK